MKLIFRMVLPGTIILMLIAACGPSKTTPPTTPVSTIASSKATAATTEYSVTTILEKLKGLPIERFFEDSFVALSLRDPDGLIVAGMAEQLGADTSHFTDISDAYIHQTQELEDGVLALLHGYDRSSLTARQQVS